jgi:opacity protein-like surface antigen
MKKAIFTFSIILLTTLAVNAQNSTEGFVKGNSFISGQVAVSSSATGDYKTTSIDLSPSFGYFLSNNLAIGLQVGVTSYQENFSGTNLKNKSGFTGGVFARYYLNPTNRFTVFGSAGLSLSSTNNKTDSLKTTSYSLGVAPGISYFLSNHFAIETTIGSLGFSSSKPDVKGADATNSINFGLNLSTASFGLVYKF